MLQKVSLGGCAQGLGLRGSFLEAGASEMSPIGGMELTRERWKRVLQAEAAEWTKEGKTKHAVF